MDAMHESLDNTTNEMWITNSRGDVIDINAVEYSIVRETEPIYTMGSPMPMIYSHRQSRYISGTLYLSKRSWRRLVFEEDFDIHIMYEGIEITLESASFVDENEISGEERFICTFICKGLGTAREEKPEVLEKMSNRQLAKRLLEREY